MTDFTNDELSILVAALEHYRREQTRLSVQLYRKNQIPQANRLDIATRATVDLMDKCSMMRK
jgi:hypothetical protein